MIARVLALAGVIVLMSAVTAQAQDEDEYEEERDFNKETSTYMELTFAGSYFEINGNDGGNRGSGGVGAIIGGHVGGIGMEVQYEWFDYSSTHLATYNLKYTFAGKSQFQPWVKAGLGVMGGRPNHAFLLMGRFEGGINLFLTEQWALAPTGGYAVAKHNNNIFMGGLRAVYYFQ